MPDTTGSNGYDGEALNRYIQAIDREHDALDIFRSEYMLKCKGPRGRIKETLKAVRADAVSMPAFREVLAKHLADRKHDKRLAALEADDADAYDLMVEALGPYADTPLGKAALNRMRPQEDVLDSLKQ